MKHLFFKLAALALIFCGSALACLAQGGKIEWIRDYAAAREVAQRTGKPMLIDFTADWCPPCRQMAPVLKALALEEGDRLKVVQLDVDHNPLTTNAYKVLSMPTFLVFRDGEPVKSMVGARAKRRLLEELSDVL